MARRSIPERGSWLLREMAYDLRGHSLRDWLCAVSAALGAMALMWVALAWAAM